MRFFKLLISVSFSGVICLLPLACDADRRTSSLQKMSSNPILVDASSANQPVNGFTEAYVWRNDDLLKRYAPAQLRGNIPIASDGAMGDNRKDPSKVQVGWQRQALEAITLGVAVGDRSVIAKGILGFKWAFDRQDDAGSFGQSKYPEVITFLGAYSRSILILRQAGYTSEAEALSKYIPQMTKAINNPLILSEEEKFETREFEQKVTNQLFWVALSYKTIHLIQSSSRINNKAQSWISEGINRQRIDGSFPERNGSDTHYQSWSLELLCLYSLYSPDDKDIIQPHLSAGFKWLSSKILPDGTMDTSGNTRTRGNQEIDPRGNLKNGRFGRPISYIYWSYLGGGESSREIAIKLSSVRRNKG